MIRKTVLLFAVPLALCGCDNIYTWNEQVEIHDGRVIIVERTDVFDPAWGNPEAGPRGKFKEARLKFLEPATTEWRSEIPPIAVDVWNANAYVVIALRGAGYCERYGNPNPPFVYFRFAPDRGWVQLVIDTKSVRTRVGASVHFYPASDARDADAATRIAV